MTNTVAKKQYGTMNGDGFGSMVDNMFQNSLRRFFDDNFWDQGQVSKYLLELMGLNVGNIIVTKLFGDKQVKLNCMAT
ncbi:MAG: AsmA family protein, partial [Chitinophagaceae bacterium]